MLYSDGSGNIKGTYYSNSNWLPPTQLAALVLPTAAWNISTPWSYNEREAFGIYYDAGSANATKFVSVSWW